MRKFAIKLDAGNDTNGNGRRVFVVFNSDNGEILDAFDPGYSGDQELKRRYPSAVYGGSFYTSASERRNLIKQFSK